MRVSPPPSCRHRRRPSTPWPSCTSAGWTSRAHRRHGVPDGRAGRGVPAARRARAWARRCSATSCCARSSPRRRPARPATASTTSCTCSPCTACCTCSATTTPSPSEEREMFALQAKLLADWRAARRAGRRAREAQRRSDSRRARHRRPRGQLTPHPHGRHGRLIVIAVLLVPLAGPVRRGGRRAATRCRGPASSAWSATGAPGARGAGRRWSPTGPGTSTCCCCCGWPRRPRPRCCSPSRCMRLIYAAPWVGRADRRRRSCWWSRYVLIGVGPRTLGRQHPYRVGMLHRGAGPGAGHPARAADQAADPHRQRDHARPGLPAGPVLLRGRAARAGRHGQHLAASSTRASAR